MDTILAGGSQKIAAQIQTKWRPIFSITRRSTLKKATNQPTNFQTCLPKSRSLLTWIKMLPPKLFQNFYNSVQNYTLQFKKGCAVVTYNLNSIRNVIRNETAVSSYRCKLVRESKNVERERARRECVVLGHRVGNQLASKQVKALGFLYPWATVWGRRSSCLRELRSLWLTVRTCDGPTPCNIGWRRRARGSSSQKEKGKTIRRRHVTADHGTQSPSRFHIHRTLPFAANPTAATPGRTFLPFNQTSFFFFFLLLHHHHHQNDHALSLSLETRGGLIIDRCAQ